MTDPTTNNTNAQMNQGGQQPQQQSGAEKQDWLDKGIQSAGKRFGVNVSDKNADKAGDMANKGIRSKEGFGLPGVQ